MKQKLGLACTLVRSPELLLLDEPTVGVDPLSRRELWDIIHELVHDKALTVLLSTSYLDEAERCEQVVVLHAGQVLPQGPPEEVSQLAAGRTFLAEPPAGQPRTRAASPAARRGVGHRRRAGRRAVCGWCAAEAKQAAGLPRRADSEEPRSSRLPPRFEDGFMVLLRARTRTALPGL